jgi:hypothetical protein
VLGLAASAILLGTWQLKFAIDARALYDELLQQASAEAAAGTLGWLAEAGFGYQALREQSCEGPKNVADLIGDWASDGDPDARLADRAGSRLSSWRQDHVRQASSKLLPLR